MRTWGLCAAAVVAAACALEPAATPAPTGPAEMALSLGLSVTPDVLSQDGASSATVRVEARDAYGQPVPGLSVRLDVLLGTTPVDFGVLSQRTLSTSGDGRAQATYQSPPPPPPVVTDDTTVTIRATAMGSNFANSLPRTAQVRLVRPGVILPPNGTPVPSFFMSPTAAREQDPVIFDASASRDDGQVVAYRWTFGDGREGSGRVTQHRYDVAGTYQVTLTVTDDRGLSASTPPFPMTIVAAASPIASFTFSPTDPRVGTSMVFNAASSSAPTGRSIVAWEWEFGDGHQATGVAPTHTFTRAGTFTVTLTVTDTLGRKAVVSRTVGVS